MQERGPYDPRKVDVWSIGVILHLMTLGGYPYCVSCANTGESRVKYAWHAMSKDYLKILEGTLNEDPEKRFTMEELAKHLIEYGNKLIDMREKDMEVLEEHIVAQRSEACL